MVTKYVHVNIDHTSLPVNAAWESEGEHKMILDGIMIINDVKLNDKGHPVFGKINEK